MAHTWVDGRGRKWKKTHKIIPCNRMSNSGYKMIRTQNKDWYLHRLIAAHFIPNPDNKPQVNHIDGDKLNNSIENLEWVTQNENMRHASQNDLLDVDSPKRKRQVVKNALKSPSMKMKQLWMNKPVLWFSQDGTYIGEFKDIYEAGKLPSKRPDRIRNNIKGKYRFGDKTYFTMKEKHDCF